MLIPATKQAGGDLTFLLKRKRRAILFQTSCLLHALCNTRAAASSLLAFSSRSCFFIIKRALFANLHVCVVVVVSSCAEYIYWFSRRHRFKWCLPT